MRARNARGRGSGSSALALLPVQPVAPVRSRLLGGLTVAGVGQHPRGALTGSSWSRQAGLFPG